MLTCLVAKKIVREVDSSGFSKVGSVQRKSRERQMSCCQEMGIPEAKMRGRGEASLRWVKRRYAEGNLAIKSCTEISDHTT